MLRDEEGVIGWDDGQALDNEMLELSEGQSVALLLMLVVVAAVEPRLLWCGVEGLILAKPSTLIALCLTREREVEASTCETHSFANEDVAPALLLFACLALALLFAATATTAILALLLGTSSALSN